MSRGPPIVRLRESFVTKSVRGKERRDNDMHNLTKIVFAVGLAAVMVAPAAFGTSLPGKLKAGKVQGNLVPAFKPQDTGSGTGDDENEGANAAFLDTSVQRSACTFTGGKFKAQVGKDATVKLKGVDCGSGPFTGSLCAHTKILSTITSEDRLGNPEFCDGGPAGNIAGDLNFVTGNIGVISCADGKCDGTLQQVTSDPCPDVDKVTELRRFEVFDGPDFVSFQPIPGGQFLKACCGPGQTIVGGVGVGGLSPCDTSTQDVMAEMGNVNAAVEP